MKATIIFSTALIFQLSAATVLQIYRTRTRQGYLGWQNGADYFTIPSSLCGGKNYECSVFNADGVAKSCNCSCPMKKSTFTPFENQWACMENSNVRTNLQSDNTNPNEKTCAQDMGILFANEYPNSLSVLGVGDEKTLSIGSNWSSCELDRNYSWYYGCSGSRLSSRLDTMKSLFTFSKGDYYYILKVPSSHPNPDDSKRSNDDVKPISMLWLIVALTVSTLFIVLIVGFLISRRNHSRTNSRKIIRSQETQDSVVLSPRAQTNSAFQTDAENGYFTISLREPAIYASMYQVPVTDRRPSFNEMSNPLEEDPNTGHVYAHVPLEHSMYGTKNATQKPIVPEGPVPDNATKFQDYGPISIEQLVYHLVEDILEGRHEKPLNDVPNETEPVYHVLEEPYRETSKEPHQYDDVTTDGPVYSTLEELYIDSSNAIDC
ncbi:hypothetical protein OS493_035972 [Desmophyllum pertusum]|uniref:Uncharacterized protein n=1 Tax=Desmophyllum pertusum TaxID=174260 RepID=A0A9W9YI97_9CNID|nr:hypothetical protein OS493_035972 [Desmophyllum pertusum]